MSFDATFEVVGNIEAKLNPVQNIDAKFGEMYESGGVDVESLSVTENGTYTAPTGKAYSPVSVNVAGGVDVSDTTAVAGDVKSGKKFHLANGSLATGSYAWNFMGDSMELVGTIASLSKTLDNSGYSTWTPSTTAKRLEAQTSNDITLDTAHYEYWVQSEFESYFTYSSDATGARAIRLVDERFWNVSRKPNSYDELVNGGGTGNYATTIPVVAVLGYYNSSNALKIYTTGSYGVYLGASNAPAIPLTGDSITATIYTPTINVRCNSDYFSTANAAKVIQSSSGYKYTQKLYRTPLGGISRQISDLMEYRYNHPST